MKRWIWLLTLPYVVTVSSGCVKYSNLSLSTVEAEPACIKYEPLYVIKKIDLGFSSEENAKDVAEALNEAHERRTSFPTSLYDCSIDPCSQHPDYWDGKPAATIDKADLDKMTPPEPERGLPPDEPKPNE